jgi:uncharacterized membrane protein
MSVHQIQAVLTGLIALALGWQVIKTLTSGEVTVNLRGRGVKRSENQRNYWSWTLILVGLFAVVVVAFLKALSGH